MKAVLVIDMPKSCYDCKFCSHAENSECWALYYSKRAHHFNTYEYYHDEMPSWCPLKPLPEHMKEGFDRMFMAGWNSCLEAVTGDYE